MYAVVVQIMDTSITQVIISAGQNVTLRLKYSAEPRAPRPTISPQRFWFRLILNCSCGPLMIFLVYV